MRRKFYAKPRDRSLQAFKEWVHGNSYRLNSHAARSMVLEPWIDNQQWIENWKKFWAKVDGAGASKRSAKGE